MLLIPVAVRNAPGLIGEQAQKAKQYLSIGISAVYCIC